MAGTKGSGEARKQVAPEIAAFYTVESKEVNPFSKYVKKVKLYDKAAGLTLPNSQAVLWRAGMAAKPQPYAIGPAPVSYSGKLSAEQDEIVNKLSGRFFHGYLGGLVVMKTGRGKSHVIMAMASRLPYGVAVLAHSLKTANELRDKFKEYCGYETGFVGGGTKTFSGVTVCTHDSFVSAEGFPGKFSAILYDEADYNLSPKMISALCRSGAKFLYGFTGTPYRKDLDRNDMQRVFGEEVTVANLENGGYNLIPDVRVVRYRSGKAQEFQRFDELKTFLLEDEDRVAAQMETISKLMKEGRKAVLLLTERVDEAKRWMEELGKAHIPAALVTGETDPDDDAKAIDALIKSGKPFAIAATVGKMARGADIPPIDTVCLFSALQFRGTVVQAVGRALRQFPDKAKPLIVDWNDLPILARQASSRRTSYRKEYEGVNITSVEHERNGKVGGEVPAQGILFGEGVPVLARS